MNQPARVLETADVRRLLRHVRAHRYPLRSETMILLSYKAGLRACEMAGLDWTMVLKPGGSLGDHLVIAGTIAKNGTARRVPMNPELKLSLAKLHRAAGRPCGGPVIASERGDHLRPRSVVNWFALLYAETALPGCSSHSGRRTFITRSARLLARTGGSLRDVQELAGHRSLSTTERYIEGNRDAQRKLVRLV
ncbi:site-specific integrase [Sphingomonas sp. CROZ-RG-20F-R02-07]|uniref:tyrosine-type recombinase/integrase n=1 Tax=Sphingomonas sp. CROZ-RG-20F-R02-07 TaxID=2914832 RepID=UPI001F577CD6|nr:site-specific integrase [Sphingomonas sp. CROZ-RG-20F-R02-07]